MNRTISTLKSDLQRKLHGTSLAKLSGVDSLIEEAAGIVLAEIDPTETVKVANFTNAIHDQIYDYTAPSDLKSNKVIDIRPQVNREFNDNFSQGFLEDFDLKKPNNTFVVRYNNAVKTIRLSKNITPSSITVDTVAGITNNGAWSVHTDGSNLTKDTLNYVSGGSSLNFDLDGSTTQGGIVNSTLTSQDLSEHENLGSLFVWVYFPSASAITNANLRWGDSASTYWHNTVTGPHDQSTFKDGWNLLRFDWNGATEVGSGDSSDITYVRLNITYDGTADTDFRMDNIISSIGKIYEIVYYSKYLFRSSAGTWSDQISDDSDLINLEEGAYNILLYQTALLISQEIQGEDSGADREAFEGELYGNARKDGLYPLYRRTNPSQVEKPRQTYYKIR